jgi:hypothetical protein
MNTSYLLEKVNLKKVWKFFKGLSKFWIDEDRKQCFLNNMPHGRDLRSKDENFTKKELYKLFNFYIPLTRILEGGDFGKISHKDTKLFRKLYAYATSDDVWDAVIELCEANETLSSQFYVPFDRSELKLIITNCIELREKTEEYKKLENRVMEEIVSNTDIRDIRISYSSFDRGVHDKSSESNDIKSQMIGSIDQIPENELGKQRTMFRRKNFKPKQGNASNSAENSESKEMEVDNPQQANIPTEKAVVKKVEEFKMTDKDFLDLQETVDMDVSNWSKIWQTEEVVVYKKKTEGTPMVMIKAIATLSGIPKDIVFEAIYDTDIRQRWDKLFHWFEVVEDDEEKMETVLYYLIKAPIGISNRDFLQKRKCVHDWPEEGQTTMHFKSIDHPNKPKVNRVIRAETIISGYILEQIQDDPPITQLTVISQNDIKGMIPKYLVNMASGKAPKQWVNNLMTGCGQLMDGEFN